MCESPYVAPTGTAAIPRPRWRVLYGVVFVGLAVLTLGDVAAPRVARPLLDAILAVAALMAISVWVRGNRTALDQVEWCQCAADQMTVRVIPSRRLEAHDSRWPHVSDPLPVEAGEEAWAVGSPR
jgi:hypothetical protein